MSSFAYCPSQEQQGCEPGPPPIPAVYIPPEYQYVRRGDNFVPIYAQLVVGEGSMDNDVCPLGWILYDGWHVVEWSDNNAGGEFGYFDEQGHWVVHNGPLTTHYRTARRVGDEVVPINPQVVRISVTVDDDALYADDQPQSSTTWGFDGYLTVWEFWITPCPYNWRPHLGDYSFVFPRLSFTAWVEPETDHLRQPMTGFITFSLFPSKEPGECLNSHFSCPYDVDYITLSDGEIIETRGIHDHDLDLQFPPQLEGFQVSGEQEEDEEGIYEHNFNVAVTKEAVRQARVYVDCFDGGAYGWLLAEISGFPPGYAIARRTDTGVIGVVEIPYDVNGNFIADMWEANLGIYPADPLGDFDNSPVGDGTLGDGLSVYEEYRGLRVRGTWTVFNPWLKDMFVMNFGAGSQNPYVPATIPNEAITSQDGFPGAGMPNLWLLNANEGSGYPLRVVNFLNGYAHIRDVYTAIVVPGTQLVDPNAYAETWGAIWGEGLPPVNAPVIEVNRDRLEAHANDPNRNVNGLPFLNCLTHVIAHELGHTVLWHRNDLGDHGHHDGRDAAGNPLTNFDCHIWQFFEWSRIVLPTDFCANNPGCIFRWKLNP